MIGSIGLMLLGAAAAPTSCDALTGLKLDNTTITSARLVVEGPAPTPTPPTPARAGGAGRGAADGGRGGQAQGGRPGAAGPRGGGPPAPRIIPEHCRVQLVLKP